MKKCVGYINGRKRTSRTKENSQASCAKTSSLGLALQRFSNKATGRPVVWVAHHAAPPTVWWYGTPDISTSVFFQYFFF